MADESYARLIGELTEERVAALTRISRTLESLIDQLRALEGGLPADGAGKDELDTYRTLRARALRYRWYLEVQREALGLRHHHRLDEFYDVPGPR